MDKSLFSVPSFQLPAPLSSDNSLYSNNALFGTSVKQSPSLAEYFQEHQTKAFPTASVTCLGPPPGLEDFVKSEDAASMPTEAEAARLNFEMDAGINNLAEIEAVRANFVVDDVAHDFEIPQLFESEMPSQNLRTHLQAAGDEVLQAMQQLPHESSFSLLLDEASQQFPGTFFDAPQGFESQELFMSSLPQSQAWDSCMEAAPPMDALLAVDPDYCVADWDPSAEEQFNMQFPAEDFQSSWHLQHNSVQEAEIGAMECPTVGSQAHFFGTCRPCAFFYTKGCGNGVLCSFCHLCDEGERKRRAKDKRVAKRVTVWSDPTIF